MRQPDIASTAAALSALSAGQRLWFWFSPDARPGHPALLVQPFSSEQDASALDALSRQVSCYESPTICTGIGSVGDDGALSFGTTQASMALLEELAWWTHSHLDAHPALSRLRNSRMIRLTADGESQEIFEDAVLWAGMRAAAVPGTMSETGARLAALAPGDSAWFTMRLKGPSGLPFLMLQSTASDPDGERFRAQRTVLQRRSPASKAVLDGVLRITAAGSVVLTVAAVPRKWKKLLQELLSAWAPDLPALRRLAAVNLLHLQDGKIVGAFPAELTLPEPAASDTDAQLGALRGMESGQKLWFWFTSADASGSPALFLAAERADLKEPATQSGGDGPSVVGQLRKSSKGWLEFRIRKSFDGFLPAVAAWAVANHSQNPELSALRGARMSQVNRDGETVERVRDDALWAALPQVEERDHGQD